MRRKATLLLFFLFSFASFSIVEVKAEQLRSLDEVSKESAAPYQFVALRYTKR